MFPILGLALAAILVTTVGQAMLKYGMNRVGGISLPLDQFLISMRTALAEPSIIAGFILIFITIPIWLQVLARLPLSVASPLVSVGYIISMIIGAVVFKETISPLKILGVALIILGVVAISSSHGAITSVSVDK